MTYQLSTTPGSITERQLSWICDMIDNKDLFKSPRHFDAVNAMDSEEYARHLESLKEQAKGLSMAKASAWIDSLKSLPRKGQSERRQDNGRGSEPEAGMYRAGETIYRVYLGQQSGRMLVKRLIEEHGEWSYEYVGAAAFKLPSGAEKLPLDEAKKWGKMTGHCCVCARRLDVPESVDAGIGPVCAGRVGPEGGN